MTVLVTGGAGYIGSHTVRALRERGREVVVLDNLGNGHEAAVLGAPLVVGDIDDGILVEKLVAEYGVDSCIHFAALKAVGESMEQPARYFRNNVAGSNTLLDALQRSGVTQGRVLVLGRRLRHARPSTRSWRTRRSTRRACTARRSGRWSGCSSWFDATRRRALGQPPLLQRGRRRVRRAHR